MEAKHAISSATPLLSSRNRPPCEDRIDDPIIDHSSTGEDKNSTITRSLPQYPLATVSATPSRKTPTGATQRLIAAEPGCINARKATCSMMPPSPLGSLPACQQGYLIPGGFHGSALCNVPLFYILVRIPLQSRYLSRPINQRPVQTLRLLLHP
jgi:hypothetical protein